jgi:hypothetical protein
MLSSTPLERSLTPDDRVFVSDQVTVLTHVSSDAAHEATEKVISKQT